MKNDYYWNNMYVSPATLDKWRYDDGYGPQAGITNARYLYLPFDRIHTLSFFCNGTHYLIEKSAADCVRDGENVDKFQHMGVCTVIEYDTKRGFTRKRRRLEWELRHELSSELVYERFIVGYVEVSPKTRHKYPMYELSFDGVLISQMSDEDVETKTEAIKQFKKERGIV